MAVDPLEVVWLTEDRRVSLPELAELSGLAETELRELVDYGAISPVDSAAAHWVFAATTLVTVRRACRLRSCFELEPHSVALVMTLLERIGDLEAQLADLRARMPHRLR